MNLNECLNILKENFCEGGETDADGYYRYGSEGNRLYLVNNKGGGWCIFCTHIKSNGIPTDMLKFSVDKNGKTKGVGKFRRSSTFDIMDVLKRSTRYAILTPKQYYDCLKNLSKIEDSLIWKEV